MDNMNQIIFESLSDGDIGHSGVIKNNEELAPLRSDYEIPDRYFVDSITLMAINPSRLYIYWEVIDATLEKYGIDPNDVKLSIAIVDENQFEISSFESFLSVGDYYFSYDVKSKSLTAKLHLKIDNNSFIPILASNSVKLFDARLKMDPNSPIYSDFVFEDLRQNNEAIFLSSHTQSNRGN